MDGAPAKKPVQFFHLQKHLKIAKTWHKKKAKAKTRKGSAEKHCLFCTRWIAVDIMVLSLLCEGNGFVMIFFLYLYDGIKIGHVCGAYVYNLGVQK